MGWDLMNLQIRGRVSAHNSDQDRKDRADWEEFVERVKNIAAEHRYTALDLDVWG